MRTPKQCASRKRLNRWFVSPSAIFVALMAISCSEPTRTSFLLDPEQQFQSLEVNYPAVNLALIAPYDTVTLSAIARNALGEQLPDTVTVTFSTPAKQIVVTRAGLVRALTQTSASGVTVTATATYYGVTLTTTTQIVVTNVASPPVMDSFSFGRRFVDTLEVGPQTGFGKVAMTLSPVAKTNSGAVIPRLIYAYQSSNSAAVAIATSPVFGWQTTTGQISLYAGSRVGESAIIRAKARVYGVTLSDSVVFKSRREPDFVSVLLFDTMTVSPPEIELYRGGDVYWINTSSRNAIGITFDKSDDVKAPSPETMGVLLFWGWSPDSGNIAPFMRDTVASPGDAVPLPPHASMVRGRSFPLPGRYHWRTTRSPLVEGTIVVR